jgi:hypothetical protein
MANLLWSLDEAGEALEAIDEGDDDADDDAAPRRS